jgi:hypothetical protein
VPIYVDRETPTERITRPWKVSRRLIYITSDNLLVSVGEHYVFTGRCDLHLLKRRKMHFRSIRGKGVQQNASPMSPFLLVHTTTTRFNKQMRPRAYHNRTCSREIIEEKSSTTATILLTLGLTCALCSAPSPRASAGM